jgi:hypothetical protein
MRDAPQRDPHPGAQRTAAALADAEQEQEAGAAEAAASAPASPSADRPAAEDPTPAPSTHEDPADVLGLANAGAASPQTDDDDEDVLGLTPQEPASGRTLRIDRSDLDAMVDASSAERGGEAPRAAAAPSASARVDEVAPSDALFAEPGVEPTRLAPGEPQEILVPLEIDTADGPKRFRLTLRLELQGP